MLFSLDSSTHSPLRTRPTLLFRLRDWEDEASWTEFYRLYHAFIFGLARRAGLPHADAEEVTQDVFKRVAETIRDFESDPARGTFRGWLAKLTRWRIIDKQRARRPDQRGGVGRPEEKESDRTRTIERLPDTSDSANPWGDATVEEAEWQQHVLQVALNRLATRVPAKHFQLFDLYARQNWPVLRVSRELGVNPATVYVVSHRLTKQLKIEVERLRLQLKSGKALSVYFVWIAFPTVRLRRSRSFLGDWTLARKLPCWMCVVSRGPARAPFPVRL
ncbi:MAG: sigma-70 family RNA polymerase sigma factor [Verrucomicrobiota bacterium]